MLPLTPLPIIDPTGRPAIELNAGGYGTGSGGSGSGRASGPIALTFNAAGATMELGGFGAGTVEWASWQRTKFDLTAWTEARVVVWIDTAAAAGATLAIEYSTDGTTWATLCSVPLDVAGLAVGTWTTMAAETAADVFLRWTTNA